MTPDEPVDLPRGMYEGRLDDKGRLRLPVAFQEYFRRNGARRVFITSLDRRTGRVYPMAAWRETETSLAKHAGNAAGAVTFIAKALGEELEIDAQGRVLIPAELRRALRIENAKVWILAQGSHIELLSDAARDELDGHTG